MKIQGTIIKQHFLSCLSKPGLHVFLLQLSFASQSSSHNSQSIRNIPIHIGIKIMNISIAFLLHDDEYAHLSLVLLFIGSFLFSCMSCFVLVFRYAISCFVSLIVKKTAAKQSPIAARPAKRLHLSQSKLISSLSCFICIACRE